MTSLWRKNSPRRLHTSQGSSGRSHGHIMVVSVRRAPSRKAAHQDSKVETFFLFLSLFGSVPAAPPKPAPPGRSCETANCTKSPIPPAPPHVPAGARARKKVSKGFGCFGAFCTITPTYHGAVAWWAPRSARSIGLAPIWGKNNRVRYLGRISQLLYMY